MLVNIPTAPCITYQGNTTQQQQQQQQQPQPQQQQQNPTALKKYAVENMHWIFNKALCVKIVDATRALLEAYLLWGVTLPGFASVLIC